MACEQFPDSNIQPNWAAWLDYFPPFQVDDSPWFCYSDNPETLKYPDVPGLDPNKGILWTHTVTQQNPNKSGQHRIFLWHVSKFTYDLDLVVGLYTENGFIDPISVQYRMCTPPQPEWAGRQFALDLLNNDFPYISFPVVDAGLTLLTTPWTFQKASFLGAQMLISNIPHDKAYTLKVLYRKSGSGITWESINGPTICPPGIYEDTSGQIHPRGSWQYSEAMQIYVHDPEIEKEYLIYGDRFRPGVFTEIRSSKQEKCAPTQCTRSGSNCAHTNRAPFGAIASIDLYFKPMCRERKIEMFIFPGNDIFNLWFDTFGAIKTTIDGQTLVEATDRLWRIGVMKYAHQVRFQSLDGPKPWILANGNTKVSLQWAVGGGASTPVHLFIRPYRGK